jgi:hypothetical protein
MFSLPSARPSADTITAYCSNRQRRDDLKTVDSHNEMDILRSELMRVHRDNVNLKKDIDARDNI